MDDFDDNSPEHALKLAEILEGDAEQTLGATDAKLCAKALRAFAVASDANLA